MNHRLTWILSISIGLLAGCGAARPSKYYELTIPSGDAPVPAGSAYPINLLLGPIRASHLYREDQIVYTSKGEEMGTYQYQRWVQPPTEMMNQILLRYLRTSGHYRSVDLLRSNSHGDYILYGRLYDFKEVDGPPMAARLTYDLDLRESKTGLTVWTHYYTHDEPVSGKDINDVVAALDRSAQRGMEDLKSNLDQYFSSRQMNGTRIQ